MNHPLDSDRILADTKKNHVVTHCGQSGFRAKLGPQTVDLRLFGYLLHPRVKHTQHSRGMAWTILGNVIRNLFKVIRYAGR